MNDGDFVKIDFIGRVKMTGEIFDLTKADAAKSENVFDPKKKYEPQLVIIGKNMVIPGVEKELKSMKVGDEKEFDVLPEDAFGSRDLKLIKIVSYAKFMKDKIEPMPGLFVDIDGKEAKIQSVNGGRVRVDFNHPLAGRELSYNLKITGQITDTKDKCLEIVNMYGMNAVVKDAKINEKGNLNLVIEKDVPTSVKDVIKEQIRKYVSEVKDINFELRPQVDRKNKKASEKTAGTGTNKA